MSSSSSAIKRSDEGAGRRMHRTTASSTRAAAGTSAATSTRRTPGKTQTPTTSPQDKHSSGSPTAPGSEQSPVKVFGLNPRAYRVARPVAPQRGQEAEVTEAQKPKARSSDSRTSPSRTSKLTSVEQKQQQKQAKTESTATSADQQIGAARVNSSQPVPKKQVIRASKYGNFYKPQDLTQQQQQQQQANENRSTAAMTKAADEPEQQQQWRPASSRASQQAQKDLADATASETSTTTTSATSSSKSTSSASVKARSRSPDRSSKQVGRRKSFDEDISTIKSESGPASSTTTTTPTTKATATTPGQPVFKTRTQFNILPPPQLSIATKGTGSMVGYAKSRIYDKPQRLILANPPESTFSLLDDHSGQIPASILSGFKPPKQVYVKKAREKWEGGEPFAKCKSRKRLAAQANKKLFPGTWSMTSVVVTQQLHLQQALAQSASSANHRSNPLETDPSVKVLTRGSVLERVQQFERAPSSTGSSGSHLSTSSSLDSFFDYEDADQDALLSRSSSDSSLASSGDGELTVKTPTKSAEGQVSSKQAQYKSRVSSIQQRQQQESAQAIVDAAAASKSSLSSSVGSPGAGAAATTQQQRRLSLRRRSSVAFGRSSTTSLIPRFYHPNGKPNTYEIEIQKRNIVACFDKLPERKAQLAGLNAAISRKHFHQIALACGYSEYFKVPLQSYVKHKLETDPKLVQLANAGANSPINHQRERKSSTIALNTNGVSSSVSGLPRPLAKAASVDSGAMVTADKSDQNGKLPVAATTTSSTPSEKKELSSITCEQFLACWRGLISCAFDNAAQFVHLLTLGQRNYLMPEDFVPLVQSIIDDHPGLSFLRAAPDFHMRYIQTVIARIYYCINKSWTGKITLQELRKSNLLAVLQVLSQEDDINQITDYFSYEHFYVIYCKFWSLDQDHDLFISKEDLARHNDAAISSRIIERIFSGIVSKQIQKTGKMSYSDFVWFLIAEEDKKHPRSIEYWFRLMDLDGDGYISMYEMEYFYYEQTKRLELMNIEALPFLDSACQILDLVNPRGKNKISLADLKRTKMATIFFDTFINLEKYLEHESREFVSTRDVVQGGVVISDWDRYASEEYESLVTEESAV